MFCFDQSGRRQNTKIRTRTSPSNFAQAREQFFVARTYQLPFQIRKQPSRAVKSKQGVLPFLFDAFVVPALPIYNLFDLQYYLRLDFSYKSEEVP